MRRQRFMDLFCLLLLAWIASAPGPAAAFGTIDSGGQHREHERLTRAALACAGTRVLSRTASSRSPSIISPDTTASSEPSARPTTTSCPTRPHTATTPTSSRAAIRAPATRPPLRSWTASTSCARNSGRAWTAREGLLDDQGQVIAGEVGLDPECNPHERAEDRAKCASLEGLGRVLHAAQDFYAHSNWADEADPARPIGEENPPGLNLPGPSPVLDPRSAMAPSVPADLTTGCYVLKDEVPGVGACELRVTHAALNKDRGLIDPSRGGRPTRQRRAAWSQTTSPRRCPEPSPRAVASGRTSGRS